MARCFAQQMFVAKLVSKNGTNYVPKALGANFDLFRDPLATPAAFNFVGLTPHGGPDDPNGGSDDPDGDPPPKRTKVRRSSGAACSGFLNYRPFTHTAFC